MTYVRSSGYLSRKIALLVINQERSDLEDCGTDHHLKIKIEDDKILNRLDGRFYKNIDNTFKIVDKTDKSLIGKTINLRSPATCTAPGDTICKKCLGIISQKNGFHLSLAGALVLTEQLTQILLSSKHLLQVNAEKITLPIHLIDYFSVDKTSLVANKDFKIKISDILTDDETEELYIDKFTIIDGDTEIEVEVSERPFYLEPILDKIDEFNQEDQTIAIEAESEIFKINIENSEVSTPLKKLIKLIESDDMLNQYTPSTLLLEIIKLLNISNIKSSALTIEFIIRELMRDPNNIKDRPSNFDSVRFLKVSSALIENKSLATSLSFERIKYLIETNLFDKTASSVLDNLF